MNLPRRNVNNLLFLPKNREYVDEMYSALLDFVSAGKTVVVLTHFDSSPRLLPLIQKSGIEVYKNKQALQRLIFICCENVNAAIKKLFDLHDWTVKPNIIIIDLYTFACSANAVTCFSHDMAKTSTASPFLQQLVQCIAVLFSMMNCLKLDDSEQNSPAHLQSFTSTPSKVFSILVLQKHDCVLTSSQVELVTDLYYGNNAFDDFKRIANVIKF
ncbi:uncharacterized protein LOC129245182 [Anastrepha obliqua]|uniref:uncharacterized protein LOC129245182 n=1 Tax=Anastrepha obliqua TaxID=95512 RepID=UPI002408FE3F|nr:uncharacterized protein LOC129245182 [Anastrepha obliqua]